MSSGDAAQIRIEGDNSHLQDTLAESRSMLQQFQHNVQDTMGGVTLGGAGGAGGAGGGAGAGAGGGAGGAGAGGGGGGAAGLGRQILTSLVGQFTLANLATQAVQQSIQLLHQTFQDMQEDEVVLVKLEHAISRMGNNARTTTEEIYAMGEAWEKSTMYTKEMAASAATVLLRFRNIKNTVDAPIFDRALQASKDFAAYMGQDVTTAAKAIGRALEDPIAGMGELQRMGHKLNETEEERIKNLVQTGRGLQAQEEILEHMNVLIEGQAEAMGKTLMGSLTQLGNAAMDLMKAPFEPFIPIITEIIGMVTDLIRFVIDLGGAFFNFGGIAGDALGLVAGVLRELRNLFGIFIDSVMIGAKSIEYAFLKVGSVMEELWGGDYFTKKLEENKKAILSLVEDIKTKSGKVGSLFFEKEKGPGGEDMAAEFDKGASQVGKFEAIEALYKRISEAAGGASPAERAAEAGEKQVALLETQNQELVNVNANLNTLIGVLPAPAVLG